MPPLWLDVQRYAHRKFICSTQHNIARLSENPAVAHVLMVGNVFDAKDGWAFAEQLAKEGGALVSPGDFYGAGGANNVRVAVVAPDAKIELVVKRLAKK